MNKKDKVTTQTIILSCVAIVVGLILIVGILLYGFGINSSIVKKISKVIPFPAAFIGKTEAVTANQLEEQLQSVRKFYESQDFSELGVRIDFNTTDGEKRLQMKKRSLLNKLIENKIIEKLAKERGIKIDREMVSQEVERKMDEYDSREYLKENMEKLYGWTIEDFKKNIVTPDIYRQKLSEFIEKNESSDKEFKSKIQKAKKALEDKKPFEQVVAEFSEGESQKDNGELGWFLENQMLSETASQIFSLEKGKTSDIIKSALGYHIIQVEDKKTENGKDMVRIRQIFVKTKNFGDWLFEQEKNISVYIPLKEFYWDKEKSQVEFSNADLRDYANQVENTFNGDTSIIF